MLITTTENVFGYEIQEYLGYISETVTFGINDLVECFYISDIIGGESSIYKNTFDKAQSILDKRLKEKAKEIGGNAIIGLRLNYNEISGKGRSSILVSGTGTVVKISMTEEHKFKLKIEKEKKIEEYNNYIAKASVKELIKELKQQKIYDIKKFKSIILEREDIKKKIIEFDEYDIDILQVMQEYDEFATLVLLLKTIK